MGYKRRSLIFGNNITKKGFALPTILISSVIMLTVLLVSVSSTTAIRTAILTQYYSQLAQAAGDAGVAYAQACLAQNGNVALWSDAKPLTPATDCSGNSRAAPAINTLVVAGGGGGGVDRGGAGGAGGYLYNASFAVSAKSYSVTVGNGGAGGTPGVRGSNGLNSSFDILTAIGGGGGGTGTGLSGSSGGSGGGGGNSSACNPCSGGSATSGQGYAGGLGVYTAPNYGAGGGGGAGGIGGNGSSTASGNGGIGIINSITGSNVYYAGGGGAGSYQNGTNGVGGLGGGGYGGTTSATAGVASTGGGGGSSGNSIASGGAGGSGIVIVSYPTGSVTANVTGVGNSCTQSGGNTVCTFVVSGSFNVTAVSSAITCPGDSRCYVMTNGNIRSSFKVGLPTLDANGKASKIPNTGYVEVLRTSTGDVWRTYNQPYAQSAVVPDFCSGTATSALGWNNAVKQQALANVLVVGGGGGGANSGAGGGAGGYIYRPNTALSVEAYPIIVGYGGPGGPSGSPATGSQGGNSDFSDMTAMGGGGGLSHWDSAIPGISGGSGGGASIVTAGYIRTFGGIGLQGNNGGAGYYDSGWAGGSGGGGGAGSAGAGGGNVSGSGNGGAGLQNSITGSAVYYAGGGGSGEISGNYAGLGGIGGGGNAVLNGAGGNGSANTGGGGAGGSYNGSYNPGGSGGSGVVVISYPTGSITATGGTITTSGGNTINTFTSSGTFTVTSVQAVQSGWTNFPDSSAIPIGISSGDVMPGSMYLRKDFSVTEAGSYTFKLLTGDNAYGYIDGNLVASSSSSLGSGSVSLSIGCHTILTKLKNGGLQSNSAYILASLTKSGSSAPIVVSDTTWRVNAGTPKHFSQVGYYADPSAWTPVRDYQDANSMASTWNATSGIAARAISTTHSYSVPYNYPATSYTYFRDPNTVTVTSSTDVLVTYVCDDGCNIYLDGQVVATGIGVVASTKLTLTEGSHEFAMSEFNNPAGLAEVALGVKRLSDGAVLSFTNPGWTAASFWETSLNNYYSYDEQYNANPGPVPTTKDRANILALVVGGGGGGASGVGGGGGGGGVSTGVASVYVGSMPVIVGAGGTAGTNNAQGAIGGLSSFGNFVGGAGGIGGSQNSAASQPLVHTGSGAGGGGGTNQPSQEVAGAASVFGMTSSGATGIQNSMGGGGGGALGAGSGANGGAGYTSNISGTSIVYGSGGGGGLVSGAAASGGVNAGNGGISNTNMGTSGVANTGGGGGGSGGTLSPSFAYASSGSGGSGVVIISYPTGSITATGGTITTSGGNTIHTFTSSGTFTVTSIN